MAVPKKKVSPSRRGMRRSHEALSAPSYQECSNCGERVHESKATFDSNYVFCSYECHGQFVGVF